MEQSTIKTIFFLGRPGSGKGTQSALLAQKLGWKIFSSGEIFRALRNDPGPLGDRIREVYDTGRLFPVWFPVFLFEREVMTMGHEEGMISEGFCRALEEAKILDEVLEWLGRKYVVVNLTVSDETAFARQMHRNETDKRPDSDTPEKVQLRLDEYKRITEPVLEFFKEKGTLIEINGEQTPDEIATELFETLQPQL